MKKLKQVMTLIMICAMALGMTACGDSSADSKETTSEESTTELAGTGTDYTYDEPSADASGSKASDGSYLTMTGETKTSAPEGFDQTAAPEAGETVATISVRDFGDIKVKFFDELAPTGVRNFLLLANDGYYDGLTFHRVINNFMIQGGDPDGTGTGGESAWKTPFYNEICDDLCVIRGSLCYANSGVEPSNGSQFFITQAGKVTDDDLANYEKAYGLKLTDKQKESYRENGGCPWLQGGYTVFGQVYEGMDVVDKIAAVEVNEDDDKPVNDVVIDSIKVSTFSE